MQLSLSKIFCVVLFLGIAMPMQGVLAQSEELIWSRDGKQFCFQNADSEFKICDVNQREARDAFDAQNVAQILDVDFGIKGNPRPVGFDDESNLILAVKGNYFRIVGGSEIEKIDPPEQVASETVLSTTRILSRDGRQDANLRVTNESEYEFELSWVTAQGESVPYQTIAPGEFVDQHTFVQHAWRLKSTGKDRKSYYFSVDRSDQNIVISEEALAAAKPRERSRRRPERRRDFSLQANKKWQPFIREHNLWIRDRDDDSVEVRLTEDGTSENTFQLVGHGTRWFDVGEQQADRGDLIWSPDGNFLIAFQTLRLDEPRVHYIESTPRDQLQPKLQSYQYPKPGDDLLVNRPRLFSMEEQKEVPLDNSEFSNPFDLRCEWDPKNDRFLIFYNERGHQKLSILSVNTDGQVSKLIEETSDTFIHYSVRAKYRHEMLGDEQFLWSSERTGWNHLYRYDWKSGELINAITEGEWNVKRVEKIDLPNETIWFYAVGLVEGQDPYHEHFCRVNFDGSGFKCLTEGDGTHEVELIREDRFILDRWSRVDQPPVREIRDASTGQKIIELHRQATDEQRRRKLPTRFVAKGRDGKTDIWGIIHWPIDFDPERSYPVVENIYAGPHDHHVPKSYRSRYGHQWSIADAGMIVVQIDGMGTAWRSKAFHDVCFQNLRDAGFPDRIAWIKAAAKEYPQMDLKRVGIYGGSAGGQNAMAALLWHNDFYKVAVADCGCHDNRMDKIWWNEQWMGWPVGKHYEENSNMENAHLLEGKLMLILGELDRNVDPASTTQVVRKLIEADKDFEFVLVAGAGHGAAETRWGSRKRLNFLKQNLAAE